VLERKNGDELKLEDEPDPEALRIAKACLSTDAAKALDMLKTLADRGSTVSAITLAEAAEKGIRGAPDLSACEKWLRRASDNGSTRASYMLAKVYLRMGQYARAYDALAASASKKYAPAQFLLSDMYIKGLAVQKNVERAIELLEEAAAQDHVYAKGRLAQLYLHGSSGKFLGGLSKPGRFFKGLRLWSTALRDALGARQGDERLET
jgi:TPR repeat protein